MLLVATHTKTCQQTGEYILLVKRGLDLVVSERRNERSTDFSLYDSDTNSATCRRKRFPESWTCWSSEEKPYLSNVDS